jgi:hypothetical protein
VSTTRYGRYAGLIGVVLLVAFVLHTIFDGSIDATGVPPGHTLPAFAVPLATGSLVGAADTATRAGDGDKVAACALRGARILNVCELYERGPVVLAVFVQAGSCTGVLSSMQALTREFPGVRFAAVALRGSRSALRKLIRQLGLTLPVGLDEEGDLESLYNVYSCPQVNFAFRGGVVQSKALLGSSSLGTLRERVHELVAAARVREGNGQST